MKELHQRSFGLLVGLLTIVALTAPISMAANSGPVDLQVLENSPNKIVLDYTFGDYKLEGVDIEGQSYAIIALEGEPVLLEAGEPALPRVCDSVIIPDLAKMGVNVLSAKYEEVSIDIAPSKGNLLRTVDPATVPYTFGEVYSTDAFYPGELVTLSEPYIMRDYRGITVQLYPFQYNPVTGVLRVYTHIQLEVVPVEGRGKNAMLAHTGHQKNLSRAFHGLYSNHFANYNPSLRYDDLTDEEDGDMLIICYDSWMTNMQPFVDHKNSIGINTTIVGVSTIGNNSTSIKNYIQNVYNTSDLAFVLLVGDAAQVATPTASGGSSDPSYSKLAGSDDYPDIMVGRFSAESSADVDTQVERSIEYENMPATTQTWFWKGTGIASNQGTGDDGEYDNEHVDNIRDDLLAYGYTEVDQIYDPSGTSTMVTNALNSGRGIINYTGHGSTTSWSSTGFSNTNVNNLVNDNMLPFIVSVACVNGQFNGYTCFGEAWLRATHNGEPTGAIGAYMSSINQSWNPPMEGQDEFNLLYCAEAYHCYGTYCFAGSCSMMDDYGSGGVEMFDTWHIFGDPSVRITGTVAPPTGMNVTPSGSLESGGSAGGPFTPGSIEYTLENQNTSGSISYEVTKTQSWLTITNGIGTIPAGGTAIVTVSINSGANGLGNGEYTDTIQITNTTDHDGDTTRDVVLTVGVASLQYQWNMDSDPGWSTSGLWAWGTPTGSGGADHGNPDPSSGYTGSNVYGYNLNGDYTNSMSETHLTSTAIDCSDLTDVSLKFHRWLNVETSTYDHAYVRISNNGSSWTTLYQNTGEVTDSSWTQYEYDISSIADNQSTVYLRWTMGTTDGSWLYSGWNIDDVELWGLAPGGPVYSDGDMNCDGTVNALDIDPFVLALDSTPPSYTEYHTSYPDCNAMLADCNGDGSLNALDIDVFVGLMSE